MTIINTYRTIVFVLFITMFGIAGNFDFEDAQQRELDRYSISQTWR